MTSPEFDREHTLEEPKKTTSPSQPEGPQALQWASAVGNSAVQRIARSPAGQKMPVGSGMVPQGAAVLARQEEKEDEEGGGEAPATEAEGGGGAPATEAGGGGEAPATEAGGEEKEEEGGE